MVSKSAGASQFKQGYTTHLFQEVGASDYPELLLHSIQSVKK
jgi:lipid II:glycine glycyltransferase (peptidoglycan interpeptide bridge formation enzyme)